MTEQERYDREEAELKAAGYEYFFWITEKYADQDLLMKESRWLPEASRRADRRTLFYRDTREFWYRRVEGPSE